MTKARIIGLFGLVWAAACGSSSGSGGLTIVSVSPADGATGVLGGATIAIAFNETLDASTITPQSVSLANQAYVVPVVLGQDGTGTMVTMAPTQPLFPMTTYILTITTDLKSTSGDTLISQSTATFTTGPGPTVTSIMPVNKAVQVGLLVPITATFSGPVSGVSPSSFTVLAVSTSVATPGTVTTSGNTATFTPMTPYPEETVMEVLLSADITDAQGNRLTPFQSTFTSSGDIPMVTAATIAQLPETPQSFDLTFQTMPSNVALTSDTIVTTFDHAMDVSSTIGATSVVDPAGNVVPSTSNVVNTGTSTVGTATVTTTIAILGLESTTYSLNFAGTAKSLAEIPVAAPIALRFTTEPRPTLFSEPHDFTTGVFTNDGIFLVFNKPMNPTTITSSNIQLFEAQPGSLASSYPITVTLDASGTVVTLKNGGGTAIAMHDDSRYTVVVGTAVADLHGNQLARKEVHTFQTRVGADTNSPQFDIASVSPINGATGVDPLSLSCDAGHGARIVLNRALDPSTAHANVSLSAAGGGAAIPAVLTIPSQYPGPPNEVDLCTVAPLAPSTGYQLNLGAGLASESGFATHTGATTIGFTTAPDAAPSLNDFRISAPAGTLGGTNTGFDLVFARPIDPSTLDVTVTQIVPAGTSSTLATNLVYDAFTHSAIVTPTAPMVAGSTINVTVKTGVQSAGGTATVADLLAGTITVDVGADTTAPTATLFAPASTNAAGNATVVVAFSKSMNVSTLMAPGAVKILAGATPQPGTIAAAGPAGFTFVRSSASYYAAGQTYTVKLTGVKDLAGNAVTGSSLTFAITSTPPTKTSDNTASGQLGPTSALAVEFQGFIDPVTISPNSILVQDTTTTTTQVLSGLGAPTDATPGLSEISVYPSSPWIAGHSYSVTFNTNLRDIDGLALASNVIVSFTVSTGPTIAAAIFAPDDGTGAPLGGFAGSCAGFPALNAVLDLTELPGALSGNSCQSALGLSSMPLWLQFSSLPSALNAASANTAANYVLTETTPAGATTVGVTPTYYTNATNGSYVKIPPPTGDWLPALPPASWPVYAKYSLKVQSVEDASNTPMSVPTTYGYRTVIVEFLEDATRTTIQDPSYVVSAANAKTPNNIWAWHPGAVKGAAAPAWVTDKSDTDYQRDCELLGGVTSTMTLDSPDHTFGNGAPTTDVILRASHLYGFVAGTDTLTIAVSPTGGANSPLFGGGGAYAPAGSGRSASYGSKGYTLDEFSLIQKAKLFGGPSALSQVTGVRAHFGLSVAGAESLACGTTDIGWLIKSFAVIAY